jgi:hypothetical protein
MFLMQLEVNGAQVEAPVSDELIEQSIRDLYRGEGGFVILSINEMTYLQTSADSRGGYVLEYQEGAPDEHYTCSNRYLGVSEVIRAFHWYRAGDGRWKTDLAWAREGVAPAIGEGGLRKLFAILGIVVIAIIAWWFLGT